MTREIWKFPLEVAARQAVAMPVGSKVLSVGNQNGTICLWALVDPSAAKKEDRCIEVMGTGHPIHQDMGISRAFVGTVLMGPFVWHVFEVM